MRGIIWEYGFIAFFKLWNVDGYKCISKQLKTIENYQFIQNSPNIISLAFRQACYAAKLGNEPGWLIITTTDILVFGLGDQKGLFVIFNVSAVFLKAERKLKLYNGLRN